MTEIIPGRGDVCYDVRMNETQSEKPITRDTLVQQIVDEHPATVLVFVRHGLHCPGCYMAPFHTVEDSARAYAVSIDPLVRDLNRAVDADVP
jgi:hybrid cluster-associated redox disulfide protein